MDFGRACRWISNPRNLKRLEEMLKAQSLKPKRQLIHEKIINLELNDNCGRWNDTLRSFVSSACSVLMTRRETRFMGKPTTW
jgi:hypothetical protein